MAGFWECCGASEGVMLVRSEGERLPLGTSPGHTAKTRHQKRPAETGGKNGASIAEFRTRRPAHICETSRYRAVFERPSYVTRWRLTGRLGREDSNLCISESEFASSQPGRQDSNLRIRNLCPAGFTAVVPCGEGQIVHAPAGSPAHDLLPLSRRMIAVGPIGHDS